MSDYNRGDVILVRYGAAESERPRLRPALVVSSQTYHEGRQQLVLAAITSNPQPPQTGDTVLRAWEVAGLLGPSLVTGVLLTVTPDPVGRRLGSLEPDDLRAVDSSLRVSLGL